MRICILVMCLYCEILTEGLLWTIFSKTPYTMFYENPLSLLTERNGILGEANAKMFASFCCNSISIYLETAMNNF